MDWKPEALVNDRELFREFASENEGIIKTKTKLVRAFLDEDHQLTTEDIVEVLGVTSKHAHRYLKQ